MVLGPHGPNSLILGRWKPAWALVATTCFQTATAADALLVVNDHQRRQERYQELHRMLTQWDEQLEISRDLADRVTDSIRQEAFVYPWRRGVSFSLARSRAIP